MEWREACSIVTRAGEGLEGGGRPMRGLRCRSHGGAPGQCYYQGM